MVQGNCHDLQVGLASFLMLQWSYEAIHWHNMTYLTGTWLSCYAHIITAVIGGGILSLGWAISQIGWIFGVLTFFA